VQLPDVNLFVYAYRAELPQHDDNRQWLDGARVGHEPLGISEIVLSSFVRIVTNHRIFTEPTPPPDALDFCAAVLASPAAVAVRSGERHWQIFEELVRESRPRGNTVPDAYLAALAIEHGATWITSDSGFARFPGLHWRGPFDA
jgi:toxin-antitoxin system PIN domain toxin